MASAPRLMPLYLNWTPTTPTLSEALAVTLIVPPTIAADAGDVMLTVGKVVSGGGALDTVMVTGAEVRTLPAASRATAVNVCDPFANVVVFTATE